MSQNKYMCEVCVAPCVGAWIETEGNSKSNRNWTESLPAWERGLKRCYCNLFGDALVVAPCVGAWIETNYLRRINRVVKQSLPAWERGLKQNGS